MRVDLETDNVQCATTPGDGDFYTADEGNSVFLRRYLSFSQACHIVMVRQCQHANSLVCRMCHELGRREETIGNYGVAMKINETSHEGGWRVVAD